MKKSLFFLISALFSVFSVFAQIQPGARVLVTNPDIENLSSGESGWLVGTVRDRLESNLETYMGVRLVDKQNEKIIKHLQKQSETSYFSRETAIEIGKMTSAQYGVFSTIRKTGSTYSLTVYLTNLTTGEKFTAHIPDKKKKEDLCINDGCAVDEAVIELCDKAGIILSSSQKYVLRHGDKNISYEDRLKQAQEEEKVYQDMMAEYDAQIRKLQTSTQYNAQANAVKLEAERARAEQVLKSARQRKEKLIEEAAKKDEDAKRDAERDEELVARRNRRAQQVAEKVAEVRRSGFESSSILSQIEMIESKKKALIEIREGVENDIREIQSANEYELKTKIQEINNQPYKAAELEDGEPTYYARLKRESKIAGLTKDYNSRLEQDVKNLRSSVIKQEEALLAEINSDYKLLEKPRRISSITDDMSYTVGAYRGKSFLWPVTVYLYSNKVLIKQETFNLYLSDITKFTKIPSDDRGYDEYINTIDMWESLFGRGDQVLTIEMDLSIKPKSEEYPSQYVFTISRFIVKDTVTGKLYKTVNLDNVTFERSFSPAYDIRSKEAKDRAAQKIVYEQQREEKIEQSRIEKQRQRITKNTKYKGFNQKAGTGGMTGLKFAVDLKDGFNGIDFQMNAAVSPYVFTGFSVGSMQIDPEFKYRAKDDYTIDVFYNIGFNWRPQILIYPPSFYFMLGAGITGYEKKSYYSSYSSSSNKDFETSFAFRPSAGFELPIFGYWGVYVQGNMNMIFYPSDFKVNWDIAVGVSFTLPELVFIKSR
ncbi:MAG: hypothetical protein MJ169_02570 [Treponema sp.]|nr:hypothetical protein [Treponema sp.]